MSDLNLSHDLLMRMAARICAQVPADEMVFFGIRGLLPVDLSGTRFAPGHDARLVKCDNLRMCCTIGQWRPGDGTVALFPGSTVPNQRAIIDAKSAGGRGANMLMLGRYRYQKGVHKAGSPNGHRAFRQAMFFPVWRNRDDLDFDLDDLLDLGASAGSFVFDNLHCAFHDNVDTAGFSSNGCQVVCGQPMSARRNNKPETGPWKAFIANAYDGESDQEKFSYFLFSGAEAKMLSSMPDEPVSRLLRFGSSGDLVFKAQTALQAEGFDFLNPDGNFGRDTLTAVMSFQAREFGTGSADGVVGPNTADALGVAWPKVVVTPQPAPGVAATAATASSLPEGWQDSAVAITCGFEVQGDPYVGVTGDFDGMGISCGALQWNIGQGSLQPLVTAVGETAVRAAMPQLGSDMWRACNAPVRDGLRIVRTFQNGNRLSAKARTELTAVMGTEAMHAQQDKRIGEKAARAFGLAADWARESGGSAPSKRQFLWFFDIVTQNGSMEGVTAAKVLSFIQANTPQRADDVVCDFLAGRTGTSGHVRDAHRNAALWRNRADADRLPLLIASFLRSETASPTFRTVVLNRKGTIAMGVGQVNGTPRDFSSHGI